MQARTGRVSVPSMNPAAHTETPIRERADHRGDHAGARSPQRRRRGRLISVIMGIGVSVLLSGCAAFMPFPPAGQMQETTSPPLAKGLSDEELLKVGADVISRYMDALSTVDNAGGAGFEVLEDLTSETQYAEEVDAAIFYAENGYYTFGTLTAYDFEIGVVIKSLNRTSAEIAFCSDASGVRIFDAAGTDITPSSRMAQQRLTALIVVVDGVARVDKIDPGEVKTPCS